LPAVYAAPLKSFPIVFYMDANLKSGNVMRNIIDEHNKQGEAINAVFVGIGHRGNYHSLRRRDFITPFIKNEKDSLISNDKVYGQAENFYLFLQKELIPYIEKNYKVNSNRTLAGHSLGGLFTFYCLFKKERLFTNFIALSPALWINHENIYACEKNYRQDSASLVANLYVCAGGAEKFNYILSGARKMKAYLEKNSFRDLHFEYYEFAGETHNSEVPVALNRILTRLKLD
jgi:predicted alpha/beta superfamily hydrolase